MSGDFRDLLIQDLSAELLDAEATLQSFRELAQAGIHALAVALKERDAARRSLYALRDEYRQQLGERRAA